MAGRKKSKEREDHIVTVILARDLPEYGLTKGDVGAVAHRYPDGAAFEVEFVTAGGDTVAVVTLTLRGVRPLRGQEILHARELAPARPGGTGPAS